jgi:hypothetical protein
VSTLFTQLDEVISEMAPAPIMTRLYEKILSAIRSLLEKIDNLVVKAYISAFAFLAAVVLLGQL